MTVGATPGSPAALDPDAILEGLDDAQRAVAANPLGPMCVLAGAGTGKTRAITHRIAYGVHSGAVAPQRLLAVTFTARAAGEMRERLRTLGVAGAQARTFHSAALRQLHFFWPRAIGGGVPDVLPYKAPLVAEAARRLRLTADRAFVRDLAAEIEWAKVSMLTEATYPQVAQAAGREAPGVDHLVMARLLGEYEEAKTQRRVIDFEDVLLLMVGLLIERPDVAEQVRAQYRHFVVDEYQDVNAVQQRLLDLWLGDRTDICVVGDPAQTIYSFTGATARHLVEFPATHPGATVVRLERNYRSTSQVVALANAMLGAQRGQLRSPIRLHAASGDGGDPASGPAPRVEMYADDEAEAAGIAETIAARLAAGVPAREVAVLFRTNGQSELIEAALDSAGIPYLVRGGERFWSREEVKRGVVLLRGAARSDDGSVELPDLVADVLAGTGWSPQAPSGRGARRDQWESLAALVELARSLTRTSPQARLRDLLADIDERIGASHAPAVDGVTLATLHSAKGLEWDVVILAGCSEGLLPISMAAGDEANEEERRLAYVGVTRARRELLLTWAGARSPGGRATRRRSRFLDPAASLLGEAGEPVVRTRTSARSGAAKSSRKPPAKCRVCGTMLNSAAERKLRRCDDCPPSYDEATYERLRTWRALTATAAKVPAYVVFTDATLTAIAENAPHDRASLSAISGVGARKLALYADDVLAVLGGADPDELVGGEASESAAVMPQLPE
ncbi:MAG: ATP-dependent DNA helicase UvrD2 [Dermatophilus congolensis]|nr:ATP-dependent DNA helicase UvrD2 [Dermatophilus congolensis]